MTRPPSKAGQRSESKEVKGGWAGRRELGQRSQLVEKGGRLRMALVCAAPASQLWAHEADDEAAEAGGLHRSPAPHSSPTNTCDGPMFHSNCTQEPPLPLLSPMDPGGAFLLELLFGGDGAGHRTGQVGEEAILAPTLA